MKIRYLIDFMVKSAIVAALYYALCLINPWDYGIINLRFAEIFIVLAFYNKKFIPGLIIGCFIVNLFSDIPYDFIIGTTQTALACLVYYFMKNKYLATFLNALSCGIIIGLELHFFFAEPLLLSIGSVFISELTILSIGFLIFNEKVIKIILRNDLKFDA